MGENPFTHIAIDGLGPVLVQVPKSGSMEETEAEQVQGTKKKLFVTAKRWLLVISCMTTRAVNVEVLDNLLAESFVHALRRHFATYGLAKSIRLDNLRSHVKMSKELNSLMKKSFVHDLHAKARELGLVGHGRRSDSRARMGLSRGACAWSKIVLPNAWADTR